MSSVTGLSTCLPLAFANWPSWHTHTHTHTQASHTAAKMAIMRNTRVSRVQRVQPRLWLLPLRDTTSHRSISLLCSRGGMHTMRNRSRNTRRIVNGRRSSLMMLDLQMLEIRSIRTKSRYTVPTAYAFSYSLLSWIFSLFHTVRVSSWKKEMTMLDRR